MSTLDLQEAADLLKAHKLTVAEKARAGIIPGRKVGRRWVFVQSTLLAYIDGSLSMQDAQGDKIGGASCRSKSVQARRTGGQISRSPDSEYEKALGL